MALFGKKEPCAICGGKVSGLFPSKVEGQLVCKECYGTVHLPDDVFNSMTLEDFKAYRMFREENSQLRQQFQMTDQVDFGFFDDHILFDTVNQLFCPSVSLENTIFEGKDVKSFTIYEDREPLFEGNANGLLCYSSSVPDRIAALTPTINQWAIMEKMKDDARKIAEKAGTTFNSSDYYFEEVPKPFEKFVVEIHCEHPYWKIITMDMKAPGFNYGNPSATDYLRLYQDDVNTMERLARSMMAVAFPDAPEQKVGRNATVVVGQTAAAVNTNVDVVEEIKRFKTLLDQGLITEEEFTAKKRQLLGI